MSRLDRQSFLGADSATILGNAVIGIVGLGGGGSHVGQQFAHAGIGRFVLVDPDTIEDSNLNRLVGGTARDVRRNTPKVEIARQLIIGINPQAKVTPLQMPWQSALDALKACDVIVGGVDSVRAKVELDAFCRRYLIPYIDMGMDVHGADGTYIVAGQTALSVAGRPCLRCMGIVTDKTLEREAQQYGKAGSRPQVIWPNGVLASTAVGLVMQLLTPWHENPVDSACLEYDGNTGEVRQSQLLKVVAKRECPHYPANERGDPGFDVRHLSTETKTAAMELTRFGGHSEGMILRCSHAPISSCIPAGISTPDGRACAFRPHARGTGARVRADGPIDRQMGA